MNAALIIGGIVLFFYLSKSHTSAASGVIPGLPTRLPFPTTTTPITRPYNSDEIYQAGQTLSDLTGIGDFATAGEDLSNLFSIGSGKRARQSQENDLVQKYQNPLVNVYFKQVLDAWSKAIANRTATEQTRAYVIQLIRIAATRFYAIAQQYPLAGPGGTRTIQNFVDGTLIPAIQAQPLH